MSLFVLTLIIWLLLGAESFALGFNPVCMAFLIAIIIDLVIYRPWTRLNKS